jgi:hypothetical protein
LAFDILPTAPSTALSARSSGNLFLENATYKAPVFYPEVLADQVEVADDFSRISIFPIACQLTDELHEEPLVTGTPSLTLYMRSSCHDASC